jgi:hypothetical protein
MPPIDQALTLEVDVYKRLVWKLGESVVEEIVVSELLTRLRHRREPIDLGLGVRQDVPVPDLSERDRLLSRLGVRLVDEELEPRRILRLRHDDRVLAAVLEVEPDQVDLVAQRGLHVVLVVEAGVLFQRLADFADEQRVGGELAEELVDLLPLVGAQVGIDRDEGGRSRGDYLGAARRGSLVLRAAARQGERKREQSPDLEEAHHGHPIRR